MYENCSHVQTYAVHTPWHIVPTSAAVTESVVHIPAYKTGAKPALRQVTTWPERDLSAP